MAILPPSFREPGHGRISALRARPRRRGPPPVAAGSRRIGCGRLGWPRQRGHAAAADAPHPVQRRSLAAHRPGQLDHLQRRQRRCGGGRLHRGRARLLRRWWADDRQLADVRLVAAHDRAGTGKAEAARPVLRRKGVGGRRCARAGADGGLAHLLGRAALRPDAGAQPAGLAGPLAAAAGDEGRGQAAVCRHLDV